MLEESSEMPVVGTPVSNDAELRGSRIIEEIKATQKRPSFVVLKLEANGEQIRDYALMHGKHAREEFKSALTALQQANAQ